MPKPRDVAAVLAAAATLLTAATGLVKTLKTEREQAVLYQAAAEAVGDQAEETMRLRERVAELERRESGQGFIRRR